jgi:hypothetical protein
VATSAALILAVFGAFSQYDITRADAVEVQHDLWANTWALYYFFGVCRAWEALHRLGVAIAVDALMLFFCHLSGEFGLLSAAP